ncbi:MAG: DUF86 domain-containing protein [Deltaproteobacteria bacterium]|nr:DUF86 domain-containing protein [Deltaproteobacteria bacterium]
MHRDSRLYLDDILEAINQIRTYVENQSEESFKQDRKTQDAVIRNLEIIGEAAGKLPEKMQDVESGIDWRKIKGLRNVLIHEYFAINLPIVWDVIQNKLGPLESACRDLLERVADP